MMSDIQNLDVMLGGNHFDREESEDNILARRPESTNCNASDNEESLHLNTREDKSSNSTVRIPLVKVLALSLINYQVNLIRGSQ